MRNVRRAILFLAAAVVWHRGVRAADDAQAQFIMPGVPGAERAFPLTPDWRRYILTFNLPPGTGRRMGIQMFIMSAAPGVPIWINGLQLEAGPEATEFQDDSVPRAMSARDGADVK